MTAEIQYAVIHVEDGPAAAWPVVERVPGGWQSGAHHYPDASVLDVTPLALAGPGEVVVRLPEPHEVDDMTWPLPGGGYVEATWDSRVWDSRTGYDHSPDEAQACAAAQLAAAARTTSPAEPTEAGAR